MSPTLFLVQRISAAILALAVAVHLATILYAAQSGMTAAHVLGRTHGNVAFLALYVVFVLAAAVHAPIGLRNVAREWLGWTGRGVDGALVLFAVGLVVLGLRAAFGMFVA
jgi:fumarate reductase subunit C